MTSPLPEALLRVLPPDTADTWITLRDVLPAPAYLVGGTAIAARLHHRTSQDLDFFLDSTVDLDALEQQLLATGPFAATQRAPGTLNGVYSRTKLQLLDAGDQRRVDDDEQIAGLRVASMRDLVAMKLKVIGDRGELRDYYDLMAIEQAGAGDVELALGDLLYRFQPRDPASTLLHLIESLAYLDDVDEDDLVPASKDDIQRYWNRRQPRVLRAAGRL
jgi:hypothetical protein